MAKCMARIENGIVINIEWCSDEQEEIASLKNIEDRPVCIGDTYENGRFYHNEVELLTPLEEVQADIEKLKEDNAILKEDNATLKEDNATLKEDNAMLLECVLEMSEIVYA